MTRISLSAIAALSCVILSGCYATLYGNQSTSGGATTTATSSAVVGSAKFAGGQVAVSSGAAPAPGTPGGQVILGRGSGATLLLGLIVVDAVSYFVSWVGGARPQAAQPTASIAETCSCYGYKPVSSER